MADIAVAGAIAVLKKAMFILGKLAAQEGPPFLTLKEDIGWIKREMGYIQTYLENANSIGEEEHENTVEAVLAKDITVLAYDVEDIVETYITLKATEESISTLGRIMNAIIGFLRQSDSAHNFLNGIESIKGRIDDIRRVRETYGTAVNISGSSRADIWEQRKHFLSTNEPDIFGLDEHIQTLVSKVFDPELQHLPLIAIVGMAGVGKTTLAKKVYNAVKPFFDYTAMVYVSQMPNISQLLLEVAIQVGLEEEKGNENLYVHLRTHLEDKRYVILLDDVWDFQVLWSLMRICAPHNLTYGSKIIITSQKKEVASSFLGTIEYLYPLEPLGKEDSWNLFRALVINPLENANVITEFCELENSGRRIVDKCGGVPLAIEVVAGLLWSKEATKYEWERVEKRMGEDDDKTSRVLALSYNDLPTELKPCFLYFGFFPEDHEVSASDIINIWVAEGFVQGKGFLEPEDVGEDYLNQLVARNMVQVSRRKFDGTVKTCRVHDLWHTFCIMVGTESSFFNTNGRNDQNYFSEITRVRRVIISSETMREINLCHEAARIRAVSYNLRNIDYEVRQVCEFFKGSKCIRVLMVEFDYLPPYILMDVGNLTNLKYLKFFGETFGFVWIPQPNDNLKNLMTLDLRNIKMVILPGEIWLMKQLRHILLKICLVQTREYNYRHEVSLPNLQTLNVVPADSLKAEYLWGFTNLRKLGIYCPTNSMIKVLSAVKPISNKLVILKFRFWEISDQTPILDLSRYQSLLKFSMRFCKDLPLRSMKMPPNLVKLTLHLEDMEDDPLEIWKSLPKLRILKLEVHVYKREEMVCSGGPEAFPQLEVLKLDLHHSSLKFVVEEQAMPMLKRLKWINRWGDIVQFETPERIRTKIFEKRR